MIFSIAQIPAFKDWLAKATRMYDRPILDVVNPDGDPVGGNVFTWPVVSTGGTLVLFAGILAVLVLGVHARVAVREWAATVHELRLAILTVTSVPALAYVMNLRRTGLPVAGPGLVRGGRLRLGHLGQRAARGVAGDRRARVRAVARAPGGPREGPAAQGAALDAALPPRCRLTSDNGWASTRLPHHALSVRPGSLW